MDVYSTHAQGVLARRDDGPTAYITRGVRKSPDTINNIYNVLYPINYHVRVQYIILIIQYTVCDDDASYILIYRTGYFCVLYIIAIYRFIDYI